METTTVEEVTQETTEEINALIQYLQNNTGAVFGFILKIIYCLFIFMVGRALIKWVRKVVRLTFERSNADKGVATFVDSLLKFGLYALLIFTIATKFGVDTASVAAVIASAGVAVGLALQGSLSNFAGGVLILVLKPFRVGDYIIEDSKGKEGTVTAIDIFYTKLLTPDNRVVVIPNGTLSNTSLTNVSKETKRRLDLTMSVDYAQDIKEVKRVIYEVLAGSEKVLEKEPVSIFLQSFDASAIVMGIRFWVKTEDYWDVKWELQEKFKEAFDENGIAIPYNHVDVMVLEKEMKPEEEKTPIN